MDLTTKNLAVKLLKKKIKYYDWIVDIVVEGKDDKFALKLFERRGKGKDIDNCLFHTEFYHQVCQALNVSDYISIDLWGDEEFKNKPYFRMY